MIGKCSGIEVLLLWLNVVRYTVVYKFKTLLIHKNYVFVATGEYKIKDLVGMSRFEFDADYTEVDNFKKEM